jgi:hypothetical protein
MARALRIRAHVDTDTLTLHDLGEFAGKEVEVIVLKHEQQPQPRRAGSPAAVIDILNRLPAISPEAVDELEHIIEAGKLPVRSNGVFEEHRRDPS